MIDPGLDDEARNHACNYAYNFVNSATHKQAVSPIDAVEQRFDSTFLQVKRELVIRESFELSMRSANSQVDRDGMTDVMTK